MSGPVIKGWCPGAYRPMMSGDGLILRVRPFRSQLDPTQVAVLCDLAEDLGHGTLDLTSRANIQIRGLTEAGHDSALQRLMAARLLDPDPATEARRNIVMHPDHRPGELTDRLYLALCTGLGSLPELPGKMGFALDTGAYAMLGAASADFRFELSRDGQLILRADGAERGRPVTPEQAVPALAEMARWFVDSDGPASGRMARHLRHADMPAMWQQTAPRPQSPAPQPGPWGAGTILGAAFGAIPADALRRLMRDSDARQMRLIPDRLFWLTGARDVIAPGFIQTPNAPLLAAHACPGAPHCRQASVATRDLARRLAPHIRGGLHVSGCAKGCALSRAARLTLTGRDGRFDLIDNGRAWDQPSQRGLDPAQLCEIYECP
ncbi:hypothetical protein [Paracoccus homiensis]|uniref:Precorrin-3B synthase n=1 Tax=Paracoccus homiensis TaxID=364199 RepID=A0A1I0DDS7_9RHOB|nr:hypothetical protein [Paracoccus homiensis]SET30484.1 precorrin-3B synthase [Paracoccus homiensis]